MYLLSLQKEHPERLEAAQEYFKTNWMHEPGGDFSIEDTYFYYPLIKADVKTFRIAIKYEFYNELVMSNAIVRFGQPENISKPCTYI